jgi:acyl carrier protein
MEETKMDKQQIFNDVVGIIKDYVKDESKLENVSMETSILDDLKVNSARLVDIIIQFEDTFDIEIDDDDADNIRSIGDAVNYIAGRVGADQGAE